MVTFPAMKMRKIKFIFKNAQGAGSGLTELQAWGPGRNVAVHLVCRKQLETAGSISRQGSDQMAKTSRLGQEARTAL
jgi:hypothetical protein